MTNNGLKAINGKIHEQNVEKALIAAGCSYNYQVRAPARISMVDGVDFRVDFKSGHMLWIHATRDLYDGTFQVGRLEHAYQMAKNGIWEKLEVFYVLERPGVPEPKITPTPRQIRKQQAYDWLHTNRVAGDIADLTGVINALMP